MNFAVIGDDAELKPLLDVLSGPSDHRLVAVFGAASETVGWLVTSDPAVRILDHWEDLLAPHNVDAVIVASADENELAAARQIAANGKPVCLLPHAAQGSAFIYELTLIQGDNRVPLLPVVPLLAHPLVERLRESITASQIGRLVLLRLERQLAADRPQNTLGRDRINAALLGDVLLLRHIGGGYDRITAVDSGTTADGVSMSTITLAGTERPEATWIARAGTDAWSLTVVGSEGQATLQLDRTLFAGRLEIQRTGQAPEIAVSDGNEIGKRVLEEIIQKIGQPTAAWAEMTKAFETVEATQTSLRRRRTVDLHFETTSERAIFKSHMTAAGCALLMLTLVSLIAFLLLGAFLDSRSMVQRTAEADGRVIPSSEFAAHGAELTPGGQTHVAELARRFERVPGPIFVAPSSGEGSSERDRQRVEAVADELARIGRPEAAVLVDVADVPHPATQLLLNVLRFAWIAPLLVFLMMQLLLFITRPPTRGSPQSSD